MIKCSKEKSKELKIKKKKRENIIPGRIEELDSKICNDVCLDQNVLSEYEKLKTVLQEIYKEKGRGAIFRSKARWAENGEKPNIFSSLRKQDMRRRLFHN